MPDSPVVATVAPFDRRGGIDRGALRDYLALLSDAGVRTILVNGTTGEFFALSAAERLTVVAACREQWSGELIAHVGATALGEVRDQMAGVEPYADAVAVIAPYFYAEPPETGLLDYFRAALAHTRKPVLLYNFPRHTQTPIPPSLLGRLAAEHPNLIGIKDSGKDRAVTAAYAAVRADLRVYLGDDGAAARVAEFGAHGIVTGGGNPVAEVPVGIAAALDAGDVSRARVLQSVFDRWSAARRASALPEIAYVKAGVAARLPGFPLATRPPLITADPAIVGRIEQFLRHDILSAQA
jgi:4-hydroxy-tetrahydrodipicolinate synthase